MKLIDAILVGAFIGAVAGDVCGVLFPLTLILSLIGALCFAAGTLATKNGS